MKTKELHNHFCWCQTCFRKRPLEPAQTPKIDRRTDLKILRKLLVDNSTSSLKIAVQEDFLSTFGGIHVSFQGGMMNENALV